MITIFGAVVGRRTACLGRKRRMATSEKLFFVLNGILKLLEEKAELISGIHDAILTVKLNRMATSSILADETDTSEYALRINNLTVDDVATATHNHDELYYKKTDTVEEAQSIVMPDGVARTAGELALANHNHDNEYVIKDDSLKVATTKLGGIPAEEFALADHNHDELYFKPDEKAVCADIINNQPATAFAGLDHTHSEQYYQLTDTVDDANYLVGIDETNKRVALYTDQAFAGASHEHIEYYTLEECEKIFKKVDEPYWFTKSFPVQVATVNYSTATLDVGSGQYDLMQSPFADIGLKPTAMLRNLTLDSPSTYDQAIAIKISGSVTAGSYHSTEYTFSQPFISDVLGVIASVRQSSAKSDVPVQAPLYVGWWKVNDYTFGIGVAGLNYWGVENSTIVYDLLVIIAVKNNPTLPSPTVPSIAKNVSKVTSHKHWLISDNNLTYIPLTVYNKPSDMNITAKITVGTITKVNSITEVSSATGSAYYYDSTNNRIALKTVLPSDRTNATIMFYITSATNKTLNETVRVDVIKPAFTNVYASKDVVILGPTKTSDVVKIYAEDPLKLLSLSLSLPTSASFTISAGSIQYDATRQAWYSQVTIAKASSTTSATVQDLEFKWKHANTLESQPIKVKAIYVPEFSDENSPNFQKFILDEYKWQDRTEFFIPLTRLVKHKEGSQLYSMVFDVKPVSKDEDETGSVPTAVPVTIGTEQYLYISAVNNTKPNSTAEIYCVRITDGAVSSAYAFRIRLKR